MGIALVRAAMGKSSKELGIPIPGLGALPWGPDKIQAIKAGSATHLESWCPHAQRMKSILGKELGHKLGVPDVEPGPEVKDPKG